MRGNPKRFHSSLASLAEVVAFVMLGLTVRLSSLGNDNEWATGLGIAALLTFLIRPVLVGLVSLPVRLSPRPVGPFGHQLVSAIAARFTLPALLDGSWPALRRSEARS
jgi:NhaP-type Na+/H+ and K+/H+ antiporter